MPEQTFEATPIITDYVCDDCGEGFMRPSRSDLQIVGNPNAKKHPHKCPKCDTIAHLDKQYPMVNYKTRSYVSKDGNS